jgi:3-hydroxypropanoate dehydrogenase
VIALGMTDAELRAEPYLAQDDHAISDAALDTIFRSARTMRQWQDKPVSPALLMAIYDLARLGPTESNITPARFHFVVSKQAKARLEPLLDEGNRKQTMAAPATAIVGYDLDFARTLPTLAPRAAESLSKNLADDPERVRLMATRSAGLQGGYFMVAARALGLDCGPMSGFDRDGIDREFFSGTAIKTYFLCNLGYGVADSVRPRAARLGFDEAAKIL